RRTPRSMWLTKTWVRPMAWARSACVSSAASLARRRCSRKSSFSRWYRVFAMATRWMRSHALGCFVIYDYVSYMLAHCRPSAAFHGSNSTTRPWIMRMSGIFERQSAAIVLAICSFATLLLLFAPMPAIGAKPQGRTVDVPAALEMTIDNRVRMTFQPRHFYYGLGERWVVEQGK